MKFEERSYSGRLFRPMPEVHIEDDGSLGVIATPWGNRQAAKKVIEILRDYVLSARQDLEATSPFQILTCLSPLANSIRAAMMLSNDSLYREENRVEHSVGVEVLVFAHQLGELAFAQVGHPSLFLARSRLPWLPLAVQLDLATELSPPPEMLPPLPHNLIGVHTTTNMNISSVKTQPGDKLILLSHSVISASLFSMPGDQTGIDSISEVLSQAYPDLPFWLGLLDPTKTEP
ncbi:MAG: hypothetical protein AB7G93_03985 [Bdellovibrionales bacterium]